MTCRYVGDVSDSELITAWRHAYADEAWVPGMPELADLSELGNTTVTAAGLQRLADFCRDTHRKHGVQNVRVVVYAPHPAGFGIVRMYQAFSEQSPEDVFVTKDLEEAKALAQRSSWPPLSPPPPPLGD